jgi:beta-N-acetylhexosaminidase
MDTQEKVGQRLMIGIRGQTIDSETKEHLLAIKPGSIILFSRNISSAAQVKELISQINEFLPSPPLIAIDQEGGRVVRFTRDVTVFPGNMALGAADSSDLAYRQGLLSAYQLRKIGIHLNLAPVVDVITSHRNPGITTRSLGDDPGRVSELSVAWIRGTQEMGVAAVAKHFPGKGAAEVDAHRDLPTIPLPRKPFEEVHLFPFKQAIKNGVRGIMTSHVHCPGLDPGTEREGLRPATFSRKIVNGILRAELGFNGVIFSDDLEMGAIVKHYPMAKACAEATLAGHDMLLVCNNYQYQRQGFEALVNAYERSELSLKELDASVKRILALKRFCSRKRPLSQQKISQDPEDLAGQIARQSITVISDEKHLLPVDGRKAGDILLLIPDLSVIHPLEEGYEPTDEHVLIKECQSYWSGKLAFHFFRLNPSQKEIDQMVRAGHKHSLCIVFLSNAQGNEGQRLLIEKLSRGDHPLIFVLLDNPFDLEFIDPKCTCITSYGYRRVQLLALINVLFGKAEATGRLPFKAHEWRR